MGERGLFSLKVFFHYCSKQVRSVIIIYLNIFITIMNAFEQLEK